MTGKGTKSGYSNCNYRSVRLALHTATVVLFLCHSMVAIADADNFYIETRGESIAGRSVNLGALVDAPQDSENDLSLMELEDILREAQMDIKKSKPGKDE